MTVILMGVSGTGKTTVGRLLARTLEWPFYEGDEFHSAANIAKMQSGIALTDLDRLGWLTALEALIRKLDAEHINAVIACSALKQDYRDRLRVGNRVRFVYLKGSYDLIRKRLESRRGHFMKAGLLASQFQTLEEPGGVLTIDASLQPETIVRHIRQALGV